MAATAVEIAHFLGGQLIGGNASIEHVASLSNPLARALIFARVWDAETAARVARFAPTTILVPRGAANADTTLTLIEVDNPRLGFALAARKFLVQARVPRISETAVIGRAVKLGSGVSVGEYSTIGDGVEIGDDSEIRHHVVIAPRVRIGRRALIKSHAVIGEEGFGIEYDGAGNTVRLPHFGGVVIGDDVEIGSCTSVCQGTIDPTVIANGVKIDDHVQVAHNVEIGENVILTAHTCVGGGVTIGRQVWAGLNSTIINGIRIGARAYIGLAANVIAGVADAHVMAGNPAKPLRKREKL